MNNEAVDLNTISSGSTLDLFEADFITGRGEIVARGFTSNGDVHTAILIPDGEARETAYTVASTHFSRSSDQSARLTREVLQRFKKSMLKELPLGRSR